jgi:hypothetical protein
VNPKAGFDTISGINVLERLIWQLLWELIHELNPALLELHLRTITCLIELGQHFPVVLRLDRAQELYYQCLQTRIKPAVQQQFAQEGSPISAAAEPFHLTRSQWQQLLRLGETLAINVSPWLEALT